MSDMKDAFNLCISATSFDPQLKMKAKMDGMNNFYKNMDRPCGVSQLKEKGNEREIISTNRWLCIDYTGNNHGNCFVRGRTGSDGWNYTLFNEIEGVVR